MKCRYAVVLDTRGYFGRTDAVRRSAGLSALLFIIGLLLFAVGASVLLGGGDLCASAGSSLGKALGGACGAISALGGALLLGLAGTALWVSHRMQRGHG